MKYILIVLFLFGCQHVVKTPKKIDGEVWLLDYEDVTLFRVLDSGDSQHIPIKDNEDVSSFICMDKDYYAQFLLNINEGCE